MDRISELPESLIHYILSFLNIQQVVKTCVLSKRWRTIWNFMPTINFDFDSYEYNGLEKNYGLREIISFKNFVLGVLSQHSGENIQKLSYTSLGSHDNEEPLVEFIICYGRIHMIRELCINIPNTTYLNLQYYLLPCKLLTVLKISSRGFMRDWGSLKLPCLRILEIKSTWEVDIEEKIFEVNMFSGCPNLESLVIGNYFLTKFRICASKLENLEFICSRTRLHGLQLELLTPNLRCVKFMNILAVVKSDSSFPYLDKVNFAVKEQHFRVGGTNESKLRDCVVELLQVFQNARSLTLYWDVLKVLLSCRSLNGHLMFHNLRHLKLKTEEINEKIDLPIRLLPCFPSLETLVVDFHKE